MGGSSWRRRGPDGMDFLYRCMEEALGPPLEGIIMTKEEKDYAWWFAGQEDKFLFGMSGKPKPEFKTFGPEPPKPKYNFDDVGVFSDKNCEWHRIGMTARGSKRSSGGSIDDKTHGPAELYGQPWRMPRAE